MKEKKQTKLSKFVCFFAIHVVLRYHSTFQLGFELLRTIDYAYNPADKLDFYLFFFAINNETKVIIKPTIKIQATKSGIGFSIIISIAITIPAINSIIRPVFTPLLKFFIIYLPPSNFCLLFVRSLFALFYHTKRKKSLYGFKSPYMALRWCEW